MVETIENVIENLGLTPYRKAELKDILTSDIFFTDNPLFHEDGAEEKIFATQISMPDTSWYAKVVSSKKISNTSKYIGTLSPEDEKALFLQYNYSKYRMGILISQELTAEIAAELIKWNRAAKKARELIAAYNLALVLSLVGKFANSRIDPDDLLSEGNLIMLDSIDAFDVSTGNKFSTYATWSVQRAFGKVGKKRSRRIDMFPVSVEEKFEETDIRDVKHGDQEKFSISLIREIISSNMAHLSDKELKVISMRFTFDGREKKAFYDEIAQAVGCSKLEASSLEKIALGKIRRVMEKYLQ